MRILPLLLLSMAFTLAALAADEPVALNLPPVVGDAKPRVVSATVLGDEARFMPIEPAFPGVL